MKIIFSCFECHEKLFEVEMTTSFHDARVLCFDCYQRIRDIEWKYKELSK